MNELIIQLTIVEDMVKLLATLKEKFDADYVKVYFEKDNNYCIKIIKGEENIKVFRRKEGATNFDTKKESK